MLEVSQGRTVQSVCENKEGGLWIGYNGNRIDYWKNGAIDYFALSMADSYVKSVLVDRNGEVWAGLTYPGTLFKLNNRAFIQYPILFPSISALYQDRKGVLWLGTQNGLRSVDNRTVFTTRNGLSANDVRALADDAEGNLWIGTEGGGLDRLRDGKFTVFNKTNGLPSDDIRSLYVDGEGVLWAGTSSGLRFRVFVAGVYESCS